MTNQFQQLQNAINDLETFVETWAHCFETTEHLDEWRTWRGEKVHVDHIYEIVDTALWAMTEGDWSLAAELLDIVASVEIQKAPGVPVEPFLWGAR